MKTPCRPRLPGLLIAGLLALTPLALPATAHAASRVTIANEFGTAKADPTYATTLTVTGKGFQAIQGGFGGVYVFFGTVKRNWRPSQGGVTGKDYLYVPDSESSDNQGYMRFIAFKGSDTESAAHGVMNADGSWSTTINVPGATFQAVDRDGRAASVNCRKVTCGVITIGAHGVKNARNESFTPVTFADLYDEAPAGADQPSAGTGGGTGSGGTTPTQETTRAPDSAGTDKQPESGRAPAKTASAPAAAVIDPDTAVVGRVLTFSGTGFLPGEQVTVSFDKGKAALGPLPAGTTGEVAGVLQLPVDTRPGTHSLRLLGAASGKQADLNFPVTADDTVASAAAGDPADSSNGPPGWLAWPFLGLAVLLLAGAALVAIRRFRAIRAKQRGAVKEPVHAS